MIIVRSGNFIDNIERYIGEVAKGEDIEVILSNGKTIQVKLKPEKKYDATSVNLRYDW